MFITLFDRGDRLGSHLVTYISQIIYAVHHGRYINYNRSINYHTSIFVIALLDFIDEHNKRFELSGEEDTKLRGNWSIAPSATTIDIQCDLFTFFRERIRPSLISNFKTLAVSKGYSVPFDPKKTILVHLRLDDVSNVPDYDGRVCSSHYRNKIEKGEICLYDKLEGERYNQQAPLADYKIEQVLAKAREFHKDHKIILIMSPRSNTTLPYQYIRSDDENYDLFLLSICETIVVSRSNYALSALFFGEYKEVYVPLWGTPTIMGLKTRYDKTKFNYFY
jgi:hypothetical protein